MQPTFSQQPLDPSYQARPPSRLPISAALWIPLAVLFAVGIVYAAKLGYERATRELDALADPAAQNETQSEPFLLDPGDEPIALAAEKPERPDQPAPPPGSEGSGTIIVAEPIRFRIIERDADLNLARVVVVGGSLDGQRFWTRADRLIAAKRQGR